jgi:hypothetical protein
VIVFDLDIAIAFYVYVFFLLQSSNSFFYCLKQYRILTGNYRGDIMELPSVEAVEFQGTFESESLDTFSWVTFF